MALIRCYLKLDVAVLDETMEGSHFEKLVVAKLTNKFLVFYDI
jgi:hypothetical protein